MPDVIIMATGSEVGISRAAVNALSESGVKARLVSMPCAEVFAEQDDAYQESVLPQSVRARVAVEAAHPDYWRKWVGIDGAVVGLPTFGESGPGAEVMAHFGFTVENVVKVAKGVIA